MDYRLTLNLPVSDFSMKANLTKIEPLLLKYWAKISIYNKQKNRKKRFILNDGPPYANGDIHIGHALNKVLKDIIVKFKILTGHEVVFIPGWDCHGLPIELNVEKQVLDLSISNENFREMCKDYANSQIMIQKKSFSRLGLIGDWDNFYKTMDKYYERTIIDSFKTMLVNKNIYRGYRPIYWCFDCSSALAEAEIEYKLKTSKSLYIFFELCDYKFFKYFIDENKFKKIGFIIWTTTPWTIPFNEAVAIEYNAIYIFFTVKNHSYIVNYSLFGKLIEKFNFHYCDILLYFNSKILNNIFLKHPIYDKKVKMFYSDHVKSDSGTGCVHIAPSHGHDDYKLALKHNIIIKNSVDENGFFHNDVPFFSNMHLNNVDYNIINLLRIKKNLVHNETIEHRYPYCWRHKSLLIFRTTEQWFLNLNSFKNKLMDIVKNNITWIPSSGKERMVSMLDNRPDWCISRQRTWGVPIILFIDNKGSIHPDTISFLNKSLKLIEKFGTEFWYKNNIFKLFSVDEKKYKQVFDVLDVWFDSSVAYKFLLDFYDINLPIDLCLEGSDQYRGWFQVSLINCTSHYSVAPYKTIISHGFVLDKYGRKMSKSLNNVISPGDIIFKYGSDVFRLWSASVNYFFDVNISDEILLRISDAYRKIRNTFRFCLANLYNFKFDKMNNSNLLMLDKWILYEFSEFKSGIMNEYLLYKFFSVYKKLYVFCVNNLAGKYLDLIKDRLYTTRPNSRYRKSTQIVLFHILYNLIKLTAPILSFTSEETWLHLPIKDKKSIFLSNINLNLINFKDINIDIYNHVLWNKIFSLRVCVNKIMEEFRKEKNFGTLLEINLNFFCNIYWYNLLFNIRNELHLFFLTANVTLNFIKNKNNGIAVLPGIYLDIKTSTQQKCERCWQRNTYIIITINGNIHICKKCFLNLYYNEDERKLV